MVWHLYSSWIKELIKTTGNGEWTAGGMDILFSSLIPVLIVRISILNRHPLNFVKCETNPAESKAINARV